MPEGDTIHKIARVLGPVLREERLERVWLRAGGAGALRGRVVVAVDARGKHLVVQVEPAGPDAPDALRVHLGMPGSWHLHRAGGRRKHPDAAIVALLGTRRHDAVCYRAPQVELGVRARMEQHGALARLGPDVLGTDFDPVVAAERLDVNRALADLLLDQSCLSGIGNVYKSELCFWAGVHPQVPGSALSPEQRVALLTQARRWMRDNLGPWMRVTTGPPPGPPSGRGDRHWVYGREGRPCLRCGARVERSLQGGPARVTYRCPRCQPAAGRRSAGSALPEPSSSP